MKKTPSPLILSLIFSALAFSKLFHPSFYTAQGIIPVVFLIYFILNQKNKPLIQVNGWLIITFLFSIGSMIVDLYQSNGAVYSLTTYSFLIWSVLLSYDSNSDSNTDYFLTKLAILTGVLCILQLFVNTGIDVKLRSIGTLGNPSIAAAMIGTTIFLECTPTTKILLFGLMIATLQKAAIAILMVIIMPITLPILIALFAIGFWHEAFSRLWLIVNALQVFLKSPWIGYGPARYHSIFFQNIFQIDHLTNVSEYQSHTEPLNFLVCFGILPFSGILLCIHRRFSILIKNKPVIYLLLLSCVQPIFDSPFICVLFLFLLIRGDPHFEIQLRTATLLRKLTVAFVFVFGLIFTLESIVFSTDSKFQVMKYAKLSFPYSMTNPKHIVRISYELPLAEKKINFLSQAQELFGDVDIEKSLAKALENNGQISAAISHYQKLSRHFPNHIFPKLALYRHGLLSRNELETAVTNCPMTNEYQSLCIEASILLCNKISCR